MKNDRIHPFRIEIAQEVLSDLRERLKNTRFSYQADAAKWALGTDIDYLRELVRYWHDTYDWRKHETALNRFSHFRTEVDDIGLHFIHERGKGSNPFPIILQGRTPDSHHDLLGNRIDWILISALVRLRECKSLGLDQGGDEEVDRLFQRAGGLCPLSEGYQSTAARMG